MSSMTATINNLTTGQLIEGLQGSRVCNQAVNAANVIAATAKAAEPCKIADFASEASTKAGAKGT